MVNYPSDWEFRELKKFKRDSFWLMPATPQYQINGVPYITSKNIKNGAIDFEDTDKISCECFLHLSRNRNISNGDILITMIGTIGEVAIVETKRKFYGQNIYLLRLDSDKLVNKFFYYFISSPPIRESLTFNKNGSTQGYIKAGAIECLLTPRPPLPEQQAIASVLSDFDEHIDNLTELIEKKKAIRDGALEDLVSGRTRLDGFDSEWNTVPFNLYFTLLPTNTYSREQLSDKGTIGNIHYGDILTKYGCVLSQNDYIPRVMDTSKLNARQYLKKNDVIIADTAEDETVGKAVQVGNIGMPLVSGLHTMACRPNYPTADGFLGYYINSKCFHNQILPYVTGIKVSSISKKSIGEIELYIPVDIEEQKAIASILIAMDKEIESLETEKAKMMEIKEGAMDDLLTGRVRLKV